MKKLHDPHGKVTCHECDIQGKPKNGIESEHVFSKVHIRFSLPSGWAFRHGVLLCQACAKGA